MKNKMNIFYASAACLTLIILSYNAMSTKINKVVEVEVVEVTKEVPVEVVRYVSECTSYDESFKAHRELLGKHGTFIWNGKEYNLYHKEEIKWER